VIPELRIALSLRRGQKPRRHVRLRHGRTHYNVEVSFRAIIFDFDGLIIDSETPLFDIWREIYVQHGATLTLDEWQHALGTQGGFDPYADLAARAGHMLDRDEWVPRVRDEHWRRCETQPLLPGVAARLDEAHALGLRTAVASSSSDAWVSPWLERHELRDRFDAICTRDDVTAVKPAPDLFLLAAERLGVAPDQCVVFEDSPNGLRAARAAGMWAVAVPNVLTRPLALPSNDLVLTSLAERTLADLRRLFAARPLCDTTRRRP
jgi:HAD superfamily hydrolase (TIGR01509 family)